MAKVITIANQKGGVGKTTTALAVAGILSRSGNRVLLVDLDAQGNATLACKANLGAFPTIAEVLRSKLSIEQSIVKTGNFDVVASSLELASVEQELMSKIGREYKLKEALSVVADKYDYIIIDTPPQLSILTVNALTACDEVIIPALADIFSLQGIGQALETIAGIQQYSNPKISVSGVLLTKYSERASLSRDVKELMAKFSVEQGTKLFKTTIRETVAVKESQFEQRQLTDYAKAAATKDYSDFIAEYLEGQT